MTDIVVGVRLKADGSGLVGVVAGLKTDLAELKTGMAAVAGAATGLSSATAETARTQEDAAAATRTATQATDAAAAADVKAAQATRMLAEATDVAAREQADLAAQARNTAAATDSLAQAEGELAARTGALVAQFGNARTGLDLLRGAQTSVAASARDMAAANVTSALSFDQSGNGATRAAFQLSDLSERSEAQIAQQKRLVEGGRVLNNNLGLQRAGWQGVAYQVQDIGIQYSMNTRISQILAMQSGQLFGAISMIAQGSENATGKLGKMAAIMGGPWGIAAGVAVSLGTLLWSELSKVDSASTDAANSTVDFSSSLVAQQGIIARSTDFISQLEAATRSLINTQALLIDNSRSVAQGSVQFLTAELDKIDKQIAARSGNANSMLANLPGLFGMGGYDQAQINKLLEQRTKIYGDLQTAQRSLSNSQTAYEARLATERADPKAAQLAQIERDRARLQERRKFTLEGDIPLADGGLETITGADFQRQIETLARREKALRDERKPKKDNSAAKAAKEAERIAQFGERAEDAIARLNDQFNIAPRDIDQARQATEKLDDIIADLEKRKPKNFEELIAQAKAVKPLIQESLVRPIRDMLDGQQRQIELGKLQVAGRQAEGEALQLTYSLMDKMGVETEAQLALELAKRGVTEDQVRNLYDNLDVLRDQTREMRVQQVMQQAFMASVSDMRENIRLTFEGLRSDGPKAIGDFFNRSLDVVDRLFSEVVTEKLFGGLFRDLEDQLTGGDKVSKAGDKLATEVGRATKDIGRTSTAILDLGRAAATTTAALNGTTAPVIAAPGIGSTTGGGENFADIFVTAKKKSGFDFGFESVIDDLKGGLKDVFTDIFGDKGIFNEGLGKTLGRIGGNAALGGAAGSSVTGLLGIRGSGQGGMLGGAIGGALGDEFGKALGSFAGPLGSIIGGTLGSAVFGALKSTPKASATITGGSDDDVSVSGNKDALKKASVGLASSVQETLDQIAEQFGGEVGKFAVSIGVRHGDYRVDTSGSGATKKKKGAVDFDEDEAGAIAYAVMDAITDGGIVGISAAVEKALRSSADLDDALEEALKVREVEELLGGLGGEMERAFKSFETQAKERLRVATEYGFDVLEIEKKNAEDRASLIEEMLEEQVGSLQRLVKEMTSGSLFEGSAIEQRDAILVQVEQAKADLEAGKSGAADTLAGLFEQLNTVSKDAYGSTGQYAADRAMILAEANAVIARREAQITSAANSSGTATSDPALTATVAALDENNDQNAQMLALVRTLPADIAALVGGSGSALLDVAGLARTS